MSLADRFSSYKKPTPGGKCITCTVVADLPADESAALVAALDDASISNAAISNILKAEGIHIGETSVRRHRKGICRGVS